MKRLPISIYILTFNSDAKIRKCLQSVFWADEIVIIDSFSTDNTLEICKEFTQKIFQHKFHGFGNLRNFALSCVSNDWVLSIDSDEVVTDELRFEIEEKLTTGPEADAYFVPRINYFLKYKITHGGWYPDYRQPQFFNRKKYKYIEEDLVHESFVVDGSIAYLKGHVIQYPFITLKEFFEKMDRYSTLVVEQRWREGKRLKKRYLLFHPLAFFIKMYLLRSGFLDGFPGLILAMLYSYYTLIKYIKLWDIEHNLEQTGVKNEKNE
jgi:glycosyltransferase involved in cell wall biosynthesis